MLISLSFTASVWLFPTSLPKWHERVTPQITAALKNEIRRQHRGFGHE